MDIKVKSVLGLMVLIITSYVMLGMSLYLVSIAGLIHGVTSTFNVISVIVLALSFIFFTWFMEYWVKSLKRLTSLS